MFLFAALLILFAIGMAVAGAVSPECKEQHLGLWALIPASLAFLLAIFSFVTIVSPGNVAVPVTFGSVSEPVGPGVHFKAPWTDFHSLSTRTQEYTMSVSKGEGAKSGDDSISVLGADAATANVDSTILYHVDKAQAGDLYKNLGGDFVNKVIRPSSRTCIRDAFAGTDIVSAATDKREAVVATIRKCIESKLTNRGLTLEDFQLRNIALSAELQKAVDLKVAAQQQSQQKVFELQKAESDARITTVEAKAKADSQQILACGGTHGTGLDSLGHKVDTIVPNSIGNCNQAQLTPAFLELQKIQALQNMVNSPNHTTLVIPEDFRGILNAGGGQ